jgi:large subunit ribosomal protein L17
MVTSLFRYERIKTTKAKALEVRKTAEKLITRSKVDTVHNRRQAARFIADKTILFKLFSNIGPRMKERPGGYTRILKLGQRDGDAADVVLLELVDYKLPEPEKEAEKAEAKKAKSEAKKADKKEKAEKEGKAAKGGKPTAAKGASKAKAKGAASGPAAPRRTATSSGKEG